jgi:hypothetical protein
MDMVCRACRGTPKKFMNKPTCILCKSSHADWVRDGFEDECNEFIYLRETWEKVKRFKQDSTGIHGLDGCLVFLFGMPHSSFGKVPAKKMPIKVAEYTPEYVQRVIGLQNGNEWEKYR